MLFAAISTCQTSVYRSLSRKEARESSDTIFCTSSVSVSVAAIYLDIAMGYVTFEIEDVLKIVMYITWLTGQ